MNEQMSEWVNNFNGDVERAFDIHDMKKNIMWKSEGM